MSRQSEPATKPDMVNHPPHYTARKWEVADVLDEFFPDDPLLWNAGKYLMRVGYKFNDVEDLKKAVWYIQRRIKTLEVKADGNN